MCGIIRAELRHRVELRRFFETYIVKEEFSLKLWQCRLISSICICEKVRLQRAEIERTLINGARFKTVTFSKGRDTGRWGMDAGFERGMG